MPLIFSDTIERATIRANPDTLYVFGDNEARAGLGGQAKECRGEPNAVGVATKRWPSKEDSALWSDDDFDRCAQIIDQDMQRLFDHVRAGGLVVFPTAGIGTGRARLPERAPRLMEHIRDRVRELKRLGHPKHPVM